MVSAAASLNVLTALLLPLLVQESTHLLIEESVGDDLVLADAPGPLKLQTCSVKAEEGASLPALSVSLGAVDIRSDLRKPTTECEGCCGAECMGRQMDQDGSPQPPRFRPIFCWQDDAHPVTPRPSHKAKIQYEKKQGRGANSNRRGHQTCPETVLGPDKLADLSQSGRRTTSYLRWPRLGC